MNIKTIKYLKKQIKSNNSKVFETDIWKNFITNINFYNLELYCDRNYEYQLNILNNMLRLTCDNNISVAKPLQYIQCINPNVKFIIKNNLIDIQLLNNFRYKTYNSLLINKEDQIIIDTLYKIPIEICNIIIEYKGTNNMIIITSVKTSMIIHHDGLY